MMHGLKNWFDGLFDGLVGLVVIAASIISLHWLVFTPTHLAFGLARIPSPKPILHSTEDILASAQDLAPIKKPVDAKLTKYILSDYKRRISNVFNVPAELKSRVEFWFKIYSTYSISHAIMHDTDHPWIIYEVVNLNSIYNKNRSRYQRKRAKRKLIRSARIRIIEVLDRLSKKKSFRRLKGIEKRTYNLFKDLPGPRARLFDRAKHAVRMQLGQRDSVIYAVKKSGRYLTQMEKIFKEAKLPVELTRIPFLESSFNLNARSKDGASGIWQFMGKTARSFMTVSHARGIDERNDPLKASHAAALLLHQNFKILKDWPLAITAYNHGPGGLLKGMKRLKTKKLFVLIEDYKHPYFSFASKNFYSEFLAMLYVEKYQDKIFGPLKKDKALKFDDIEMKYAMRVKYLMEICDVTQADLKRYNPDLRSKALNERAYLPQGYYLKLPKGKAKNLHQFYKKIEDAHQIMEGL